MNDPNTEQMLNLRLTLAVKGIEANKSLVEIEALYEFVKGPQSSIVPATNFTVVKQ